MLGDTTPVQFSNEIKITSGVVFGLILQYFLGDKRGFRVLVTIAASSIFVALFIVPAAIEIFNINPSSKFAIAMYALSAFVSVEILVLLIKYLPKAISDRITRALGVQDDMQK